jgi:predicted dehydrogenase
VPDTRYLFLLGTEANVRWDRVLGLVVESEAGSESITLQEIDTIQEEIDEFALCIATNSRPEVGGVEALAAVTVIEAAVLSNERGRAVDIAELLG